MSARPFNSENPFLWETVQVIRRTVIGSDDGTPYYDPLVAGTYRARLDTTMRMRRDFDARNTTSAAHFNYAICFIDGAADVKVDDLLRFPDRGGEDWRIEDIDYAAGATSLHHLELIVQRASGALDVSLSTRGG